MTWLFHLSMNGITSRWPFDSSLLVCTFSWWFAVSHKQLLGTSMGMIIGDALPVREKKNAKLLLIFAFEPSPREGPTIFTSVLNPCGKTLSQPQVLTTPCVTLSDRDALSLSGLRTSLHSEKPLLDTLNWWSLIDHFFLTAAEISYKMN